MKEETKNFFKAVELLMNKEEYATNCKDYAVVLEGLQGYNYLRITEEASIRTKRTPFEKIKAEIMRRVELLCMTKLNGVNMFRAINEHAISVINYHVVLLKLKPADYRKIDFEICQVLIKHHIHLQPTCKERIYLSGFEM
ncbi:hypothetical protein NGRA_1476 [Nosema granulosis]|uniref:Uncharacterized protein n=1 Tax=Nosema granulosis TaxID=83296 RepID=A0A9P6GZF0_9MICR|nr:hypothetical protein NGRA_1476 [Nosema granulosis]